MLRKKAYRSLRKPSIKNCKSHVFFHRGSVLAGTLRCQNLCERQKANILFLFVCSARTTERVGNKLPGCCGLTP